MNGTALRGSAKVPVSVPFPNQVQAHTRSDRSSYPTKLRLSKE
jgi:hypothetical protein